MGLFGDIIKGIGGGVAGFVTGGPIGAVVGAGTATGLFGGGGGSAPTRGNIDPRRKPAGTLSASRWFSGPAMNAAQARTRMPLLPSFAPQAVPVTRVPGIRGAAERFFPGGATGFQAVPQGGSIDPARGLPMIGQIGVQPGVENRAVRRCPSGYRLAVDGLCYPRSILPKRSKLRAWPAGAAAPVTAADARALNKVTSIRKKVKDLGTKADLRVTKK